jgi:hypothetical protein
VRRACPLALAVLLASCSRVAPEIPAVAADRAEPVVEQSETGETRVEMMNVNIHLDPVLVIHIQRLEGKLVRTNKSRPPTFDDKLSYTIAVDSAEISVNAAGMTHLMNAYIFSDPDAPLKNIKLSLEGGKVRQEGTIRKGPGIPFEMKGDVSPTPDGKIRIHATEMKAGHLPVKGLLKLFGVDMAKLINTRHTRGIRIEEDDIIFDPSQALPAPKMSGRITAVEIRGDEIVQTFGPPNREAPKKTQASNYMYYRGGVLGFGRLTMHDTDMRLVDADPSDPFDFFPDHYAEQLVAGYSKTGVSGGLVVHMPDYSKVSRPLSPR